MIARFTSRRKFRCSIIGGIDVAITKARAAYDDGDYRWAAELLDHVLFADETSTAARTLQADCLEQLGFGAENGTWRNAFLSGAHELRHGNFGSPTVAASAELLSALTVPQVFDSIAIRVDGPRAWDERFRLVAVLAPVDPEFAIITP